MCCTFRQSGQLGWYCDWATGFTYEESWFNSWQLQELLLLNSVQNSSGGSPAVIQWKQGAPFSGSKAVWGVKVTTDPPPVLRLRIHRALLQRPFSSTYALSREMNMPLYFLLHSVTTLQNARDSSQNNNIECKF